MLMSRNDIFLACQGLCKYGVFARRISAVVLGVALSWSGAQAASDMLDCPLRDKPFSGETPLLDVLLNPQAEKIIKQNASKIFDMFPAQLFKTTAPSFAAIVDVNSVLDVVNMQPVDRQQVIEQLAKLPVTDIDRKTRCERYDNDMPEFTINPAQTNVLVFTKINGFDHGPSVGAATNAIKGLADQLGWAVSVTDKGGAFNTKTLAQFDVVVWNNNSGDVLTLSQRKAFEDYINQGGGFFGIHGAGGDTSVYWDFYVESLIGAHFIGHPMDPQFQLAQLNVEGNATKIGANLRSGWQMKDEWYSFSNNPRKRGAEVIVTLDEDTYVPIGLEGKDLRMGADHPLVWTQCVKAGRAFYTAIGHRPEVYYIPENLILLREGLVWAADKGARSCQ